MSDTGLFIVPARGGSKRLPGKHMIPLNGATLIERTARCLTESALGFPVLLTTDAPDIRSAGEALGWNAPFLRPAELASDSASTLDTILHALDVHEAGAATPDVTVVIQATSPFRPAQAVADAIRLLREDSTLDAVVGMRRNTVPAAYHYPEAANLTALNTGLEPVLVPNGTVYAIRTEVLRRDGTLFPERLGAVITDWVGSIDIDTPDDWNIAEALAAKGLTGQVIGWAGTELPWSKA